MPLSGSDVATATQRHAQVLCHLLDLGNESVVLGQRAPEVLTSNPTELESIVSPWLLKEP